MLLTVLFGIAFIVGGWLQANYGHRPFELDARGWPYSPMRLWPRRFDRHSRKSLRHRYDDLRGHTIGWGRDRRAGLDYRSGSRQSDPLVDWPNHHRRSDGIRIDSRPQHIGSEFAGSSSRGNTQLDELATPLSCEAFIDKYLDEQGYELADVTEPDRRFVECASN